jgi:hypothetical protein
MYVYTWKCHKKTHCVAILNKQKWKFSFLNSFTNIREKEGRTGPACVGCGWYQQEGGRTGEREWEGEYNENPVYTCM